MLAIGVSPEYRSVARSLSEWGPKGEPDAPITAGRESTDLLSWLKLIRRLNSSMLAIGVEPEYRSAARSLFGWGFKGETNAPIAVGSEVVNFLLGTKMSCCPVRASHALLIGLEYALSGVVVHCLSISQRSPIRVWEPRSIS
jgi:hypothetical protein